MPPNKVTGADGLSPRVFKIAAPARKITGLVFFQYARLKAACQ